MRFLLPIPVVLIFFVCVKSYAHPHVFIDCQISFEIKDNKLTGIIQRWTFDEMFSSMVIADYDTNRNRRIDGNEINILKKEYFDYLSNSSFFTKAYVGKKAVSFKRASGFMPMIDRGKLIYNFRLDADNLPIEDLKIAIFDNSYYSDIKITSFNFSYNPANDLGLEKVILKDVSYYFGQVHPEAVRIFKK